MVKFVVRLLLFLVLTSSFLFSKILPIDYFFNNEKTYLSFFVLNDSNKVTYNFTKSDFIITENGLNIGVFDLSNSTVPIFYTSTVLFLFDQSIGYLDPNNKSLALNFTDTLMKALSNSFESLIGFDFNNFLYCNFTKDINKATSSLKYIAKSTASGSNLDTALFAANLGALNFIANATSHKNIILLTDKSRDFDYDRAKQILKQYNTKLIILLFNTKPTKKLLDFSRETNSFIFQIFSLADAEEIVDILRTIIFGGSPALIEFQNSPLCTQEREITVLYRKNDTLDFHIEVQNTSVPQISAHPPFLRFSSVIPSQFKDLDLVLVARNFDVRIDSITLSDPHFQIISGKIKNPIVLSKDSALKLTIRFTPTDSSIVFDSLIIHSEACFIKKVNITGGFPNKKPKERTLSVISPQCGDYYYIGDTVRIRWDGLLPTDVVQLQYSTNGGEAWDTLAINVLGLEYKFYLDPNKFKESDSCLIRIIQIWPNNAGETIELRHLSSINSANFNRDASLIITASNHPNEFASIWNPGTGRKLYTLKGHTKQVNWACFDYLDRYAITASDDSTSILYDIKTGDSLFTFKSHNSKVTSANFSPDGNYLITSGTDGNCFVWDLNSKSIVKKFSTGINPIYFAMFTPDSNHIAYASYDGNIYLYDIKQLKVTKTFITKFGNNHIHHFSINPENRKLAAASHLGLIFVFDYNPEDTTSKVYPLYILAHDTTSYPAINTTYFNSNGQWLISAGSDSKVLRWNPSTGELIDSIAIAEHSNSVTSALFSFDDAMLLTSSWDSTAKIFNRTKLGLQIDTTNCMFAILTPKLASTDVNFGDVFLGTSKDTIIKAILINNSRGKVTIENITLPENEFSILNKPESIILNPSDTLSLLINFAPRDTGLRTSEVVFYFKGGKVSSHLVGRGIMPPLKIEPNYIDIGDVEVGEYKDTLLLYNVKNQSPKEIKLITVRNIGPDSLFFAIIDGGEPTFIQPLGYHPLTIRFTPDTSGARNTIFEFRTDVDSSSYFLSVFGNGIYPTYDSVTISVGNFEAKPGDIINIPIILKSKYFTNKTAEYAGIGFDFSFNKTILEVLDKSIENYVKDDLRTIKIKANKNIVEDSVLVELQFRVGLGNDTITPLLISNSYPMGKGKIVIKEESGSLALKGICKEGGPRLFEPDGTINIGTINPNPTEGITSIEFETMEKGRTKLILFDNTGSVVNVLVDEELSPGRHTVSFDARNCESGIYLLILQTANSIKKKTLLIVK
jgi:WD40 repeat protein